MPLLKIQFSWIWPMDSEVSEAHMLSDLWFSEPINIFNLFSKHTLFLPIPGDSGDRSAFLTAVESLFAWKMQQVNGIIGQDSALSAAGYWDSSIRRPSSRPFHNRDDSLCILATARVRTKYNNMTQTQHYNSLHPETPMTCLPIYRGVLPFTVHSSQQSIEEIIFPRGGTCLCAWPPKTFQKMHQNTRILTFSCITVLCKERQTTLPKEHGAPRQ